VNRKRKEKAIVEENDLEIPGAGEVENLPPSVEVWDTASGNLLGDYDTQEEADAAIARITPYVDDTESIVSILVPSDSTDVLLSAKVGIFELLTDGQRGQRLYLGPPTGAAISRAYSMSKGGIVIEADPPTGATVVREKA
jgi:hypothetical protein